jgi:hypothetical protein
MSEVKELVVIAAALFRAAGIARGHVVQISNGAGGFVPMTVGGGGGGGGGPGPDPDEQAIDQAEKFVKTCEARGLLSK